MLLNHGQVAREHKIEDNHYTPCRFQIGDDIIGFLPIRSDVLKTGQIVVISCLCIPGPADLRFVLHDVSEEKKAQAIQFRTIIPV